MATSPNYAWAEPDNSSLVKNGASDIRTLGDAIDTSLWNSGFGQAGKNKLINADFNIWQRGTSFTLSGTAYTYTADRWECLNISGATTTVSRQAFTAGTAPVAGYESSYFLRYATTDTTVGHIVRQKIEDVRTFAGQAVTVSFWAKVGTGTKTVSMNIVQSFGSGGSSDVGTSVTFAANTVSTTWTRFTGTVTLPSITGKTIGTSSYVAFPIQITSGNATLDIWGCQIEYGLKATPFQTASGGSPQAELAMCQRYYYRFASEGKTYAMFNIGGYFESSTKYIGRHQHPVAMRTNPTTLDYANLSIIDSSGTFYAVSAAAIDTNTNTTLGAMINFTVSGATASRFGSVLINNNTGAYLGIGAEL